MAGAGLSAYFSDTWGQGVGVKPLMAFLGGAMMLFGARLASGCTRYELMTVTKGSINSFIEFLMEF